MQATVYKSTGSWYILKNAEGDFLNARIKGKLKINGITSTNPIAVGDIVEYEIENEVEQTGIISKIFDRKNYINRQSPANKHAHHIIASNLDQSLLFATLKNPKTSTGFLDRFLLTCEAYHVPAVIVFNKADVYEKKEMDLYAHLKTIYEACGYQVHLISVQNNTGIDALKLLLKDKVTLLSGHSGVGKSTFINAVFPEFDLRTAEVSDWSGKGMHTTTFAEMFDLPEGGSIIDTPGIRELGIVDVAKVELSQYFPEMKAVINNCQFNDCLHFNEKKCGVKDGVNDGTISEERYVSYLTLLEGIEEKKY